MITQDIGIRPPIREALEMQDRDWAVCTKSHGRATVRISASFVRLGASDLE